MTPRTGRIGVVLAGGRSTRMGRDKARLMRGGRTWLEHTLVALAPYVDELWVVGRIVGEEDCPTVRPFPRSRPDEVTGLGPVGGIRTALALAGTREVLVAACDLPALDGRAPTALLRAAAADSNSPAFAFTSSGAAGQGPGLAALFLLLRPGLLAAQGGEAGRSAGREQSSGSVTAFLLSAGVRWVEAEDVLLATLVNANAPGDPGVR